jgi:hypothetical protein
MLSNARALTVLVVAINATLWLYAAGALTTLPKPQRVDVRRRARRRVRRGEARGLWSILNRFNSQTGACST